MLLTTSFVFFAFILSCGAFYEVALCASPCYIKLAPWFVTEMFDACWGFLFDSLTVVMCVVVTLVSSLGAGCTPQLQSRRLSAGSFLDARSARVGGDLTYAEARGGVASGTLTCNYPRSTKWTQDLRVGGGLWMYRMTNPIN